MIFCYCSATKDPSGNNLEQPSFGVVRDHWGQRESGFLREAEMGADPIAICARPLFRCLRRRRQADVVATITDPALRVTDTEWISHNVMPGEETKISCDRCRKTGKGQLSTLASGSLTITWSKASPPCCRRLRSDYGASTNLGFGSKRPGTLKKSSNGRENTMRIALINGITSSVSDRGPMWPASTA